MRRFDQVVAHHAGPDFVGPRQRRQHAHERGLAGAVRAEDGENHAARHFEIDAVDRAQVSETLHEAARLDGQRRRLGCRLIQRSIPLLLSASPIGGAHPTASSAGRA